jgi:hypothetical protein
MVPPSLSLDELPAAYEELLDELRRDGVRLVDKRDSWLQRVIDVALSVVTMGKQSAYLTRYVTTIGRTIYVTPDWEERPLADRYVTLLHERVHLEQFRRWGVLLMGIAYLLLPLPVGLAWFRMRWEREAYEATVRATYALHGRLGVERIRAHVCRQFTSGSYAWMWPFPKAIARWYDGLVGDLEAAEAVAD